MLRQFELVDLVRSYDPEIDEDLLNKAYVFSLKAHGAQMRESGAPFFSHPVEVAGILATLKLDYITIVAALLHDTVEDTVATLDDLKQHFGNKVVDLVNGVTKLSNLEIKAVNAEQAENFRKLVLAMAADIRVLLIKIADRMHNMQTLHFIKDKQRRVKIAIETLDIYAPLASRVGLQKIKEALEDLAFKELHENAYEVVCTRLKNLCAFSEEPIEEIATELKTILERTNIKARVFGRIKTPYSIWKKMITRNTTFEQLCDVLAFRIIVQTLPECYQVLGVLHNSYWVIPGRFKDYISTPKENNYQALHTAVISPRYQRVEIQIRTEQMDLSAEYGIAAHWQYKQDIHAHDGTQYQWIRNLLQAMEQADNPNEFLENTKLEMFQDQVFCFSEEGELFILPKGVTPIDFAYAISTWSGDHISAVSINGKSMPLQTIIQNGDQLSITTSEEQKTCSSWGNFVRTGQARSRIRNLVHTHSDGKN
ncbi:MAG: RelA/SpoT family protein [Holosporales bacterium]|jgi:GTP pyrophosphokinase|nr:RelA/SpoT family protein [Holosporales bacterium]